ncbi:hypothetical protein L1887_10266 [Cichorium endivia]|nr:hypothetical protein L1887_10266 [Cichorium endivia]
MIVNKKRKLCLSPTPISHTSLEPPNDPDCGVFRRRCLESDLEMETESNAQNDEKFSASEPTNSEVGKTLEIIKCSGFPMEGPEEPVQKPHYQ